MSAPAVALAYTAPFCLFSQEYNASLHDCSALRVKAWTVGTNFRMALLIQDNVAMQTDIPLKASLRAPEERNPQNGKCLSASCVVH